MRYTNLISIFFNSNLDSKKSKLARTLFFKDTEKELFSDRYS